MNTGRILTMRMAAMLVAGSAAPGAPIAITTVDLSPAYPWAEAEFDKAYAPEIEAEKDKVEWRKGAWLDANGMIELRQANQAAGLPVEHSVVYARVILDAEADGKIHLSMGSDDGLAVFVNGKNVFRNNAMRALTADQDQADVDLVKGKNVLLFRVTQGGGGWSLQVKATGAGVKQVPTARVDGAEGTNTAAPAAPGAPIAITTVEKYNVVWDSPSADARGSMPIGNGDIGLNVWVEPSGDLCFFLGKTDAWDESGRLLKLNKVRIKFQPALDPKASFRWELKLGEGLIEIRDQNTTVSVWVDANHPVVQVDAASLTGKPRRSNRGGRKSGRSACRKAAKTNTLPRPTPHSRLSAIRTPSCRERRNRSAGITATWNHRGCRA